MFIIPVAVIAIIFLLIKVLVPIILIISLFVLLYFYCKNRGEADEKIESAKEIIMTAKDKASNILDKVKFVAKWLKKDKKEQEEDSQELQDV